MAAASQLTRILSVVFVRLEATGGGPGNGWIHSCEKINNDLTAVCVAESGVDSCTNALG